MGEANEVYRAALGYAAMGWRVFPVHARAKAPATPHGFLDATTDPELIRGWFEGHPEMNVGVATGEMDGRPGEYLVAVDLDCHDEDANGYELLAAFLREGGHGFPDTCCSVTGTGGLHLFFVADAPMDSGSNGETGVDVKCVGGYVVEAPSTHPNGRTYAWETPPDEIAPQPMPEAVRRFLELHGPRKAASDPSGPRYEAPAVIGEGGRNNELARICGQMWAKGVDADMVRGALHEVNRVRCSPPLPEAEVDAIWRSITSRPQGHSPQWEAARSAGGHAVPRDGGGQAAQEAGATGQEAHERPGVPAIVRFQDLCDDLPPRAPVLIDGVLRCGHKLMVAAQSKAGKTWMLLELAVSVASGSAWLGHEVAAPGPVLYINLEIDEPSCYDRIMRICRAMGVDPHAMADLDVWPLRGAQLMMPAILSALRESGKGYSLIIVDPIYKVNDGDENSAADMARFCSMLDALASSTGAAVAFAHHFAKGSAGGKVSMDRASGSGVFARDPDAIVTVSALSLTDEAEAEADGRAAFRMEYTLREFPPMEPRDVWFAAPVHELDGDGVLAACPVEGSQGERSAKGVAAKASKNADRYAERNAFIGGAVRMCVDAGEEPTQTNVARMLRGSECEGSEITYHKLKDWLKSRWCSYTLGEGGAVVLKDGRSGAA